MALLLTIIVSVLLIAATMFEMGFRLGSRGASHGRTAGNPAITAHSIHPHHVNGLARHADTE